MTFSFSFTKTCLYEGMDGPGSARRLGQIFLSSVGDDAPGFGMGVSYSREKTANERVWRKSCLASTSICTYISIPHHQTDGRFPLDDLDRSGQIDSCTVGDLALVAGWDTNIGLHGIERVFWGRYVLLQIMHDISLQHVRMYIDL